MGVRVAIVGCGEGALPHLRVLGESPRAELTALCDLQRPAAEAFAREAAGPAILDDWTEVPEHADVAIVALPHHLHARASCELLERGVHVLVEAPMALSAAECHRMNAASAEGGATLAVGFVSRFFGVARHVKRLLDAHAIGRVHHFDVREGGVPDWKMRSDHALRPSSGGGVLGDLGAHVFDLLLYWLGDVESVDCHHDARGGAEADCEIGIRTSSGVEGFCQLSRRRDLRNTWILEGEQGTLEVMRRHDAELYWRVRGSNAVLHGDFQSGGVPEGPLTCYRRQWDELLDAIEEERLPLVSGVEGARCAELIELCRRDASPLEQSWESFDDRLEPEATPEPATGPEPDEAS